MNSIVYELYHIKEKINIDTLDSCFPRLGVGIRIVCKWMGDFGVGRWKYSKI